MTEFIWFFGASAAGKDTMIRRLHSDPRLKKLLGIGNPTRISYTSMCVLGGELDQERNLILIDAIDLISQPDITVLIKGQSVDLEANLPFILNEKRPEDHHKIVFIWVDPKELFERNKSKHPRGNSLDNRIRELKHQVGQTNRMLDEISEIICVDNTNEPQLMNWQSALDWYRNI